MNLESILAVFSPDCSEGHEIGRVVRVDFHGPFIGAQTTPLLWSPIRERSVRTFKHQFYGDFYGHFYKDFPNGIRWSQKCFRLT